MFKKFIGLIGLLLIPATGQAAPISSYDITNAINSGAGGWSNTYTGTKTATGSSSASTYSGLGALYNYTGGVGTLNDGVYGTNHTNAHLLAVNDSPFIDLFFSSLVNVASISLFSFNDGNSIPGSITSVDVSIGGNTQAFATTDNSANTEFVNLSGSALANIATNNLRLSNFAATQYFDLFAISEIVVNSTPTSATVPLPASAVVLLSGLGAVGGLRAARKKA